MSAVLPEAGSRRGVTSAGRRPGSVSLAALVWSIGVVAAAGHLWWVLVPPTVYAAVTWAGAVRPRPRMLLVWVLVSSAVSVGAGAVAWEPGKVVAAGVVFGLAVSLAAVAPRRFGLPDGSADRGVGLAVLGAAARRR